MRIAIVNDIHIGKPFIERGQMRAASHLVSNKLHKLFLYIQKKHSPDLVVNLGDLIRSESRESDLYLYKKSLDFFDLFPCEIIHLIGNHEIKQMTISDIKNFWKKKGFSQDVFGMHKLGGLQFFWLGMNESFQGPWHIPEEQLIWLDEMLSKNSLPSLLFVHLAIDDHDVSGCFFPNYPSFFPKNQKKVRDILLKYPHVKAVFQAHVHYFHVQYRKSLPFISLPAMVENVCGPDITDNFPEVYTILDWTNERFLVKCYSREYCFSGLEL